MAKYDAIYEGRLPHDVRLNVTTGKQTIYSHNLKSYVSHLISRVINRLLTLISNKYQ